MGLTRGVVRMCPDTLFCCWHISWGSHVALAALLIYFRCLSYITVNGKCLWGHLLLG